MNIPLTKLTGNKQGVSISHSFTPPNRREQEIQTMPTAPVRDIADTTQKDKDVLFSIVKEMSESITGAQSTRHWAADALWFDIPAFASKGVQPACKFFDKVFSGFESCKVDILETDIVVNGDMGSSARCNT